MLRFLAVNSISITQTNRHTDMVISLTILFLYVHVNFYPQLFLQNMYLTFWKIE